MRPTKSQLAARTAIVRLTSSGLPPTALAEQIAAALTQALPNDGFRVFGVDPTTLLVNRLLAASESDGWARREWLRDVYLAADQLPYIELPRLMGLRLPVVASQPRQSECWGYPADILAQLSAREHARAFHEIGSPVGGTILASFASRGSWVAALQLYRRDAGAPFSRSDIAFLRSLVTPIGDALAAATAREQALLAGDAPGATGVVIVRRSGEVSFATPAGERWLGHLRAAEPGNEDELPTPVAAAVAGLRASDGPSQRIVAPLPTGQLAVEASPAGQDDAVAVVLALRQPPAEPTIPASWPLTSQERQVAGLLARGLTNRAISETLFISENTVQTHLRHIYGKLGTNNRTQLLARLFRESAGSHLLNDGAA